MVVSFATVRACKKSGSTTPSAGSAGVVHQPGEPSMRFRIESGMWLVTLSTLLGLVAQESIAQNYPTRPVRLIVPFAPGGTTDVIARIVSARIVHHLGQPFIVENRGGAGGVLGAQEIARAAPDGYTLGVATVSTIATAPALDPKVAYNPLVDFTPIINIAATPNILVVNASFPAKEYSSFVAELHKSPDKYHYATPGTGSISHLAMELLKSLTGVSLTHVPYKGAGPAMADLISGQVQVMLDNLPTALPHIRSGRVVPMVVASEKRVGSLPEIPTFAEIGLPQLNRVAFYGIHGPRGLSIDVRIKVNSAVRRTLDDPLVLGPIEDTGSTIIGNSPEEFGRQIAIELEIYKRVVEQQKLWIR